MINQQTEYYDVSHGVHIESLKIEFENEFLKYNFNDEFYFDYKSYVKSVLSKMYDYESADILRKNHFLAGTSINDYLYKLISPIGNLKAVCGIFFRRGDLNNAYVKILLISKMELDENFLNALKDVASLTYAKFNPKNVEIFLDQYGEEKAVGNVNIIPFERSIVGSIQGIVEKNQGKMISSLCLNISQNMNWYKNYTNIYMKNTEYSNDCSKNWPRAESEENIKECFSHGLLFDVQFMGDWIGIIAGKKDILYGSKAITVVEIILDHDYRGTNLGKYIYVLFSREIAKRKDLKDYLFLSGNIFYKNKLALNAAMSCGRKDIGGSFLI
ncbi:hypothetical protein [Fluviispira multicolorata]|uniref:Uncharacterized protein n=1 Tax=Fluviispira multicolorata TaxID=2654512 RepID=A0A833JCW8_9BACT|nr:hypothetical protein [Fluviispira multicolorata]KAB8029892.1 hypothetical protein GCL57_10170 [Fluviispira multicolorata]